MTDTLAAIVAELRNQAEMHGSESCDEYNLRASLALTAWADRLEALSRSGAGGGVELGPIQDNEFYKTRFYIPLPGGWEIQTKGSGSSFRICDTKTGERLNVCPQPYLYETLEQMAREIHAALTPPQAGEGMGEKV